MSELPCVYECLAAAEDASVDDLLLDRLEQLETAYQSNAVEVLLRRGADAALLRLVGLRHRLPDVCQQTMAAHMPRFERALGKAIHAADQSTRLNAIDMICSCHAWFLAYVLPLGLRHQASETRRRAADGLLAMAQANVAGVAVPAWSTDVHERMPALFAELAERRQGRGHITQALTEAIASYDAHLRNTAVEAALLLAEELEDTLLHEATRWPGRFWRAVLDKLGNDPGDSSAALVLMGLADDNVRGAASRMLAECTDCTFFRSLWGQCWLLGDARIRAGLQTVRRLAWLEHHSSELFDLPPAELRQAVRFLQASALPGPRRVELYKDILLAGGPDSQLIALFALIDTAHPAALEALQDIIHWAEPRLADIARREVQRHHPLQVPRPDEPTPRALTRATDDEPMTFQLYWQRFGELSAVQRTELGMALLQRDERTLEKVVGRLSDPSAEERLQALLIIRLLKLTPRCAADVMDAVRDADSLIRGIAIKALEDIPGPHSERLLLSALSDGDARVRANAIEVLGASLDPRRVQQLAPCLQDPHHRVRTAAIDALLRVKVPEAARALLKLLDEPSRAHRASGLWLIDKLNLADVVGHVKHMAREDPDERVRRHARRILRAARRQRRKQLPIPKPQEPAKDSAPDVSTEAGP